MLFKRLFSLLIIFSLCSMGHLFAKKPYSAVVTVDQVSHLFTATNILGLSKDLRQENLQEHFPFYTPNSPVYSRLKLRGLNYIASFAANSTTLSIQVPKLGVSEQFTGASRDESVALFKEWLGDETITGNKHFLKAHAKFTPIDPIAGNPNSLLYQMAEADYQLGRLYPFDGCECSADPHPRDSTHLFRIGIDYLRTFSHKFDSSSYTLPLRYSCSPNGRWAFILDVPLSLLYTDGAYSAFGSTAFGFRYPVTANWSLTPITRFGFGGSVDLSTAGSFADAGITSGYHIHLSNGVLTLINTAAYYASTNFWLGGVNFNYRLHNWVYKNGLNWTACVPYYVSDRPFYWSAWITDTQFRGDKMFIDHYDEAGFSVMTSQINSRLLYDSLSAGFAYQWGENNLRGYRLHLIYHF